MRGAGGWQLVAGSWWRIAPRGPAHPRTRASLLARRPEIPSRLVEHQDPVDHFARIRRDELAFAGGRERPEVSGFAGPRVEPPRARRGPRDGRHADAEWPPDGCVDHRIGA